MAHSFAEERERIFNVLASNLNAFFPEAQNTVVCPLCRSAHGRDSLLGDGLELTREHCIPASAGGKLVTLTCRACNNSHGISSDSHLKNLLLAEDAVEGIGGTVDGTISIEGHPFRCEVGFGREGEKSLHFTPIVKASNSKERDTAFAIVEASSNTGDDFSANLELRFRYCPFRSNLVLVKAAYLLMFKQFGYSYMFFEGPEFVRRLILEPDANIVAAACGLKPPAVQVRRVNRALIVTSPEHLRCFVLPIQVRTTHRTQIKFVILPGFDDDPKGIYDRWQEIGKQGNVGQGKFIALDAGPESLTDPHRFGALALWDHAFGRRPRRIRFTRENKEEGPG